MQRLGENALYLPSPCSFPTMTIMMDESPGQIMPVAYKRRYMIHDAKSLVTLETFSVKLGHLLLFLSLVLPFSKLQNNSHVYHLTSCLLFIEVDKGGKTSLRFVRYT